MDLNSTDSIHLNVFKHTESGLVTLDTHCIISDSTLRVIEIDLMLGIKCQCPIDIIIA